MNVQVEQNLRTLVTQTVKRKTWFCFKEDERLSTEEVWTSCRQQSSISPHRVLHFMTRKRSLVTSSGIIVLLCTNTATINIKLLSFCNHKNCRVASTRSCSLEQGWEDSLTPQHDNEFTAVQRPQQEPLVRGEVRGFTSWLGKCVDAVGG